MNDYYFLIAIASVLFLGAMSPGPSFIVVARNSLNKSRSHGIATAVGTGLGVAVFAVLASFGVTTLLNRVPTAFLVFKIVGGCYLVYLAWRIWCAASEVLQNEAQSLQSTESLWQSFLQGLAAQTSNPKTALVIAGIFAAFVPVDPPALTVPLIAMIAFIIDFSWYAFVALSLSIEKSRKFYAKAKVWLDRIIAVLLALIGLRLILLA